MKKQELGVMLRNMKSETPRSVKIEVGHCYRMTDATTVEILGIRTNGEETMIYYQYPYGKQKWYKSNYAQGSKNLEQFKAGLMELGAIDSLTVTPFSQ